MRLLELGGGTNPHPLAEIVLDIRHPDGAPKQDISTKTWATNRGEIPDDTVEAIYASHVLEHIDKGQPRFHVMNEAWRVLKPGGTFTIKLPLVGYTIDGVGHLVTDWRTYADPTHLHGWWAPQSFDYFCDGLNPADGYVVYEGLRRFAPLGPRLETEWSHGLVMKVGTPDADRTSWWSIWDDWEGVVQLVKP